MSDNKNLEEIEKLLRKVDDEIRNFKSKKAKLEMELADKKFRMIEDNIFTGLLGAALGTFGVTCVCLIGAFASSAAIAVSVCSGILAGAFVLGGFVACVFSNLRLKKQMQPEIVRLQKDIECMKQNERYELLKNKKAELEKLKEDIKLKQLEKELQLKENEKANNVSKATNEKVAKMKKTETKSKELEL